jgi:hypothetical protein
MPRYYMTTTEQAQAFVDEIVAATEGRLRPTRRGRVVTTQHGARHGFTYMVDEIARRIDHEEEAERYRIVDAVYAGAYRFEPCANPDPNGRESHWYFHSADDSWHIVIVGLTPYLQHARFREWQRAIPVGAA